MSVPTSSSVTTGLVSLSINARGVAGSASEPVSLTVDEAASVEAAADLSLMVTELYDGVMSIDSSVSEMTSTADVSMLAVPLAMAVNVNVAVIASPGFTFAWE